MTPAMIHPRTRKPRRRPCAVGTRIDYFSCRRRKLRLCGDGQQSRRSPRKPTAGVSSFSVARSGSIGAARFVHDCQQAPTTGMRGRERLAGREALPASGGLERVVVGVGALALLGGNPTQEHSFRRGVVDATRVHGGEQIADAVVELLTLPFAVARADAM